jgi:hypothetical protein
LTTHSTQIVYSQYNAATVRDWWLLSAAKPRTSTTLQLPLRLIETLLLAQVCNTLASLDHPFNFFMCNPLENYTLSSLALVSLSAL